MDHGLTSGAIDGLIDPSPALALATRPPVTGVVVNRGFASWLAPQANAGLVLQTFGLPAVGLATATRVPTCRIDDAIRLSADAIAVQLNLNGTGLSHALQAVSRTMSDAAEREIPVIMMLTAESTPRSFDAIADAVRIGAELGADLIKVALPPRIVDAESRETARVRDAVARAPPVLLAGGEQREDFAARLAIALELGFSGACVGRSIFQAPYPDRALAAIADVLEHRP